MRAPSKDKSTVLVQIQKELMVLHEKVDILMRDRKDLRDRELGAQKALEEEVKESSE